MLYTHLGDTAASRETLRTTLVAAAAAAVKAIGNPPATTNHTATEPRSAGLPDPDVDSVDIEVAIRHPLHDLPAGGDVFQTLYRTTRTLSAMEGSGPIRTDSATTVPPLAYVNAPNILGWSGYPALDETQAPTGAPLIGPALPIPRGRDVRILVRAKLRAAEANYLAPEAAPTMATTIAVRCEPHAEGPLLAQADAHQSITGYLFRRPPDVAAPGTRRSPRRTARCRFKREQPDDPARAPHRLRRVLGAAPHDHRRRRNPQLRLRQRPTGPVVVAIVLDLNGTGPGMGSPTPASTSSAVTPRPRRPRAEPVGRCPYRPARTRCRRHTNPTDRAPADAVIFLDAIDPHEPVGPGSRSRSRTAGLF